MKPVVQISLDLTGISEAIETAAMAIEAGSFQTAGGDVRAVLRQICERVHGFGDVPVGKEIRP